MSRAAVASARGSAPRSTRVPLALPLLLALAIAACTAGTGDRDEAAALAAGDRPADQARWWKGNLHTHSVWSDGDAYPELVAAWYRDNGYNFVAFTEHDLLPDVEQWYDISQPDEGWPPRHESMRRALPAYRAAFGHDWVEERRDGDAHRVRLRRLSEFRHFFEEPDSFLILVGEEITDHLQVHVNAINLDSPIEPQGGEDRLATLAANLAAVEKRRVATGRPILAVVNHPNFVWSLTAEDIAASEARFFEVYNGHQMVENDGDDRRKGTDRIWDIVLATRLAEGRPLIYGVATDDAHNYLPESEAVARPGRGWVMVRAERLGPDALIGAMEAGTFYASTGVTLRDVRFDGRRLELDIEPEAGVEYTTRFIGTRAGWDPASRPVLDQDGEPLRTTRRYSAAVGAVLAEVRGTAASYPLDGDELYVRAIISADPPRTDPTTGEPLEPARAWVQPVTP